MTEEIWARLWVFIYMVDVENKVFNKFNELSIYVRYIDDMFIITENKDELKILKEISESNSVLQFA